MYRFVLVLASILHAGTGVVTAIETPANDAKSKVLYVAPQAIGSGRGDSKATASDFRNSNFWLTVRQSVQDTSVIVDFLDGKYTVSSDKAKGMPTLSLADLGHKDHPLVLQGNSKDGVVFTRLSTDSLDGNDGPGFLEVTKSQNLIIRNLHFTGRQPISYASNFGGNKHVLIEGCSWIDLPRIKYGATGTSWFTDHVTYTNCVFKRVGNGLGAHMSYNSDGAMHIAFVNCHFEDCSGDYVRFRSGADFGVVAGCTFKSTGKYQKLNVPFITVPVFNDDDPLKKGSSGGYEYFGTHFLIANNTFSYANEKLEGDRVAFLFHHSGFDPPGRNHLLTAQEGELIAKASAPEKRAFLLHNLGISADHVHFFDNDVTGTKMNVGYRSYAAYGATSKGWKGIADISDTINVNRVIDDIKDALTFFE